MNILGSIVPGIRELRTPITSGLLWLSAIVIFGVSHHMILIPTSSTEIKLRHLSSISATLFSVPAILTGALLLGNVMVALINPLIYFLGRRARNILLYFFSLVSRSRPARWRTYFGRQGRRLEARTRTVSTSARGLVIEANSRALAKVGVPGSATLMLPLDEVLNSLKFTAPQLAQTAETQYQEYDRARSEAQFRVAVCPRSYRTCDRASCQRESLDTHCYDSRWFGAAFSVCRTRTSINGYSCECGIFGLHFGPDGAIDDRIPV